MQLLEQQLILSPSDLTNALACSHLTALSYEVALGERPKAADRDAAAELLAKHGDAHELRYLEGLRAKGRSVAEVKLVGRGAGSLAVGEAETLKAMRSGADIVYQATFFDGRWRGHADFLEKVSTPSDLGDFSYEVIDTKLARHVKVSALLQTSNYSEHLARLQGITPERMHIELGDGTRSTFRVTDFDAYYRTIKRRFEASVAAGFAAGTTYPDPVRHCAICDWADVCSERRTLDDHLSLVAGMRATQIEHLHRVGIDTSAALVSTALTQVPGIGDQTFDKLRHQATLQLEQRKTGESSYELLEPSANAGLGALPEPSEGDLFFDMEGDPYVGRHGIEYLFGVIHVENGTSVFETFWGHDEKGEKKAFEDFIDFVTARRALDPNLHIFHYAPYEVTAMKKLAARYNTREWEVDRLLSSEVFVDLYRVVKQGVRISQPSYSIKKLETFYMDARETEVLGGAESILKYEEWLESGDQKILDDIEAYNRDDCESTLLLRNWLEERRAEAVEKFGEISRFAPEDKPASSAVSELETNIRALSSSLLEDEDGDDFPDRSLLVGLLEWHRRESKAEWWRYFELHKMSEADLYEDREALSGLTHVGIVDEIKSSVVHRYSFDPTQDYKISIDSMAREPFLKKSAGTVVDINGDEGWIDIKRARSSTIENVRAIVPPGPIDHKAQQNALLELGQSVTDGGLQDPPRFRAAIDLLTRRVPRLRSGRALADVIRQSSNATDAACALAVDLDSSCLAIQGPPGSGKTYSGAEIVLALVAKGLRVGITANGHKVIGNVLEEIVDHARGKTSVRVIQKADEKDRCAAPEVECLGNEGVAEALSEGRVDVVGGTAWLFSREEMREQLDVLIVDEAGQMSLADVMAVSTSAKSLILLGDPQQLSQPSKGIHPDGAGLSALRHLLGRHQTIPDTQGLLLDKTWRMHPAVCDFVSQSFYESRLSSQESCAIQQINGDGSWSGAGLRYLPVEHRGNRTSSVEEAEVIVAAFEQMLQRSWTDRFGIAQPLTLDDVLVVAPYNAQVSLLKKMLPEGAKVGTVDKFQGQEAAVVFYSLAVSSPDDISRGMDFLYSTNRLNVAVSRARCISVVVGNPELLTIVCHRPKQARRVNALCRYVELAEAPSVV